MARRFDHLADVEAFIAVAENGSLSAAAVELATTPTVISRAIKRLETHLGVQLLRLTTRRMNITDAGLLYLNQTRLAFAQISEVERSLSGPNDVLNARLRVSAPTTYGHYRLPALLAAFCRIHPQVRIELSISNHNVDLVADNFDMAIRMGSLPDSALIARKLEDARLCLVAAPQYLLSRGVPKCLDDLQDHQCLPFIVPSSGRVRPWQLMDNGKLVERIPVANVQISDDVLGVVSMAKSGLGLCQTYHFIVEDQIRNGLLVEVLEQFSGCSRPFSIIYSPHRQLSTASNTLISFLLKHTHDQR